MSEFGDDGDEEEVKKEVQPAYTARLVAAVEGGGLPSTASGVRFTLSHRFSKMRPPIFTMILEYAYLLPLTRVSQIPQRL